MIKRSPEPRARSHVRSSPAQAQRAEAEAAALGWAPKRVQRRVINSDQGRAMPTKALPRFDVQRYWDADSTPPALAALSRMVGAVLPNSGARTPTIEAGVVLASLMHDVGYYYGGSAADKAAADERFGKQIMSFTKRLDPSMSAAGVTAFVDVAAVTLGGGFPFKEDYSWSYGFAPPKRGFSTLAPGEHAKINQVAQQTLRQVVRQLATGTFTMSAVLKGKLAQAPPKYQAQLKAALVTLAKALNADFESPARGRHIPGFER